MTERSVQPDPAPPTQRARHTPDALSLFLGACVALLVCMYVLDMRQTHDLEAHAERARDVKETLAKSGPLGRCAIGVASATGAALMVRCEGLDASRVKRHLTSHFDVHARPPWLEHVAIRDDTGTLLCTGALDQCARSPRQDSERLRDSRRRVSRQPTTATHHAK